MSKTESLPDKQKKHFKNLIPIILILVVIIGLPYIFLNYQSKTSGLSRIESLKRLARQLRTGGKESGPAAEISKGDKSDFLVPVAIGMEFSEPPLISHLQVTDLDGDGLQDVIVCDCRGNFVSWIRQFPEGIFTEIILADEIIAPAHVRVVDFDLDGDPDLVVAVLGMLFPNNDKIGSVVILENDGQFNFTKHVIVEKIARVSDARAGDLDNDGDLDLAVAQFGYDDGETRWIENLGNWKFRNHILQNLSGPVNIEIIDIDHDGDMDIISLVSQEWEEIYCFLNDGKGNFQPKLLFGSSNQDFGSSGIALCDLDQDGETDILYTNGDAFDYIPPQGRPWHGVNVLMNNGDLKFRFRRLCLFTGATNVRAADIDNDGDIDLFAVSAWNLWDEPESRSLIWLENTGDNNFIRHEIANDPTHLICCEPGDLNNDGHIDLVTGGMHTYPPYDRMARVTLWYNNGNLTQK